MIASQDVHAARILDLESEEQTDGFNALPPAVNIVPHKQILGFRRQSAVLEHSKHIIVLSVNVPAHFHGRGDFQKHGFFHKDILDNANEGENVFLLELHLLSRFGGTHLQQLLDDLIDVELHLLVKLARLLNDGH